ncbi:spore germination protein [Xylanibacillus composti]|uniref:Spore germination protein KA n=1 Tax=Xylanibacillus composti TaxID=1572762 RepID=A0A8J4M245_9BACL|nr:spore germination protein [Xylanibacillus composti]MDT9726103.1 spore germination protein [Xylanibacillus composti]GIQ68750.1 spore germination protein KA [Xylanibacillus composti]
MRWRSKPEPRQAPAQPSLAEQVAVNLANLQAMLGHSSDLVVRELRAVGNTRTAAVYLDGISDKDKINAYIFHSLLTESNQLPKKPSQEDGSAEDNLLRFMQSHALAVGEVKLAQDWDTVILSVLSGDTVLFVEGHAEALVCGTKGGQHRSVEEPSTQLVIRGPKESFTESIGTNVALVRKRIRSKNLRLETMKIGLVTQTDVAVMYINGIASEKIVKEIKDRLHQIDTDAILESGYIEQWIEDESNTPFPTIYNTERPDTVAGNLLEGRIAIFVDGTPFVLIAPTTFFMHFQSSEDYYQRFPVTSFIRLLRYGAFLIALFGPSVYIAAITFHQEMIPTELLISLAAQRDSVPFPAFIEALLMEVAFEILREAGVRMPRAVGQAVSIVGALVLGQAAVEAGIVSSMMVIVVAITGISSFANPSFGMSLGVRVVRFLMMVAAALFGFYGMAVFSLLILTHMCSLRSFGIPYMSPFAPFILEDHKDTLVRFPHKKLFARPRLISQQNMSRQGTQSRPDEEGS